MTKDQLLKRATRHQGVIVLARMQRDEACALAHLAGATLAEISEACGGTTNGMSVTSVHRAIQRYYEE